MPLNKRLIWTGQLIWNAQHLFSSERFQARSHLTNHNMTCQTPYQQVQILQKGIKTRIQAAPLSNTNPAQPHLNHQSSTSATNYQKLSHPVPQRYSNYRSSILSVAKWICYTTTLPWLLEAQIHINIKKLCHGKVGIRDKWSARPKYLQNTFKACHILKFQTGRLSMHPLM